jgi:hypothetical protein
MSILMNTLEKYTKDMALNETRTGGSRSELCDAIVAELDRGIIEKNKKERTRTYLGASSLGDPCARKIQYRYMGFDPDEDKGFPGKTLRTFSLGHAIEDLMVMMFRDAGFDLRVSKSMNDEQFGFSIADGEIRGHIDGVICGGPLNMPYPMLWECKSANDKKFKEFVNKGVAEANPVYAAQVALYQTYMDLADNPCVFTVLNKNTSEVYIELVPYNKKLAQDVSDKAVLILEASKAEDILPRIAQNEDFYMCKWCEFHKTCWEKK